MGRRASCYERAAAKVGVVRGTCPMARARAAMADTTVVRVVRIRMALLFRPFFFQRSAGLEGSVVHTTRFSRAQDQFNIDYRPYHYRNVVWSRRLWELACPIEMSIHRGVARVLSSNLQVK